MSKRYNIRWTEADNQELARSIKNFNAKVSRLEKKYGGRSDIVIPEKVSMKELREVIGTRRDLQREVKSLQRFTQRGAEQLVDVPITENNIKMTKWQRTEMNRRKATINTMRNNRLSMVEDIEAELEGTKLGYKIIQFGMGEADKNSLKPIHAFTDKMGKYDLLHKYKALRKHSQSNYFNTADQRLMDNFTTAIEKTYGTEAVKELVEEIRKMPLTTFYKHFKANPGEFEYAYTPDGLTDATQEDYLKHLYSTWYPNYKPKIEEPAEG